MSHREAYVPPVRQTGNPNRASTAHLSLNGASSPNALQNGASTPTPRNSNSSSDDDGAPVLMQSPTRRTNIVSAAETSASLNQPQAAPAAAAQAQARMNAGRAAYDTADQKVYYICGACNMPSGFKSNDMLRCLNCGGLTMFKPRVKGIFQYSAN